MKFIRKYFWIKKIYILYHKFGSNEKANTHGLHLLRGDFDEVRENERQMKKWKEFIQVESGAYRLDAWPLITINEFLEKKLKYDMSLGMKTT